MILGEAGTGKTTLISSLRDKLNGNVAVVAFTGVAALTVSGETIHSFFGFPITVLTENTTGDPRHSEKIKSLSYLIIDEISMVRADILDAIFNTLTKYGSNPNKIFGGIRVILVGDIMQLDPVLESDDDARRYFYNKYQSSFFFESKGFLQNVVSIHVLRHKFRQENDSGFGDILSRMRIGKSTADDLKILNKFVNQPSDDHTKNATWLTNTNERVEAINQLRL